MRTKVGFSNYSADEYVKMCLRRRNNQQMACGKNQYGITIRIRVFFLMNDCFPRLELQSF